MFTKLWITMELLIQIPMSENCIKLAIHFYHDLLDFMNEYRDIFFKRVIFKDFIVKVGLSALETYVAIFILVYIGLFGRI